MRCFLGVGYPSSPLLLFALAIDLIQQLKKFGWYRFLHDLVENTFETVSDHAVARLKFHIWIFRWHICLSFEPLSA